MGALQGARAKMLPRHHQKPEASRRKLHDLAFPDLAAAAALENVVEAPDLPPVCRGHHIIHPSFDGRERRCLQAAGAADRKSTRLNSSHVEISYAVFCLK